MRYAVYFTPPQDAALTRAASSWLGRDAFSGAPVAPARAGDLSAAELAFHTASARRYGFHATLKAPFTLASGKTQAELVDAVAAFAGQCAPVRLPRLVARQLDGFFALVPAERYPPLDALAGAVVRAFEPFRAPLADGDIARRNPAAMTPAEVRNLHQWGYPYVFEEFRFHMTLTGRASGQEAERLASAIDAHFAPFLSAPLEIASIALFVEPEPGAPFTVRAFHPMGRHDQRKTA